MSAGPEGPDLAVATDTFSYADTPIIGKSKVTPQQLHHCARAAEPCPMGMPQRSEQVVRRSSKDKSTTSPGLISAEVFKGVLVRERKRADCSKQPFVLVLVSANDAASKVWAPAVEALTAAKRETDILGLVYAQFHPWDRV